MLTGNFALLAGMAPDAVHEWYLTVYADAYEWVELPNTLGMSQFADGGLLGSKPYIASAAYIKRMRTSDNACPFNALYWDFLARHRAKLARNPRMAQMYRTMDGFASSEMSAIRVRASEIRSSVETL